MKICKQILGVHRQTTNIGVLLELGRTTLDLDCIKLGITNWERLRKNNANTIVLASYLDAMKENLPWITGIKEKKSLVFLSMSTLMNQTLYIKKYLKL